MTTTETDIVAPTLESAAETTRRRRPATGADVLAEHSSSFRLAARLLPADQRRDATLLYAVCRLIDDIADEYGDEDRAVDRLDRLRAELEGRARRRPMIDEFVRMADRRDLETKAMFELIDGVESDLGDVRIESDDQLVRYCYRVAGTVGLMMCAVLDVDDPAADAHAIDLGIAMQLTNICRDVLEDARRNRVYLPASRLREVGISPGDIPAEDVDETRLALVVEDLLEWADDYYLSGDEGMRYIPPRGRLAIAVAARIYRTYGTKLKRRGTDPMAGPPQLTGRDLTTALGAGLTHWARLGVSRGRPPTHRRRLHRPLSGLPGVRT